MNHMNTIYKIWLIGLSVIALLAFWALTIILPLGLLGIVFIIELSTAGSILLWVIWGLVLVPLSFFVPYMIYEDLN